MAGRETFHTSEEPQDLIDDLVRSTRIIFETTESFIEESGIVSPFGTRHAAYKAVRDSGIAGGELMGQLVQQTSIRPKDLFELDNDQEDWNEFQLDVGSMILREELIRRYPELIEEESKREKML